MSGHEPYRPSNGTEGDMFMGRWCAHCAVQPFDLDGDGCPILNATMCARSIWDDDYPLEWRQDGPSGPRCTAFRAEGDVEPLDPAAAIGLLL